jgi:hypothetical protein
MRQRSSLDFKRALRKFCTEHDLLIEEKSLNGPNERIVIYERKGQQVTRVASLVMRRDQKELSPGWARVFLVHLKQRLEKELEDQTMPHAKDVLGELIHWLGGWFN